MTQDLFPLRSKSKEKKIHRQNFDIWVLSWDFWYLGYRNHFPIWEVLGLPLSPEPSATMLVSCAPKNSHGKTGLHS